MPSTVNMNGPTNVEHGCHGHPHATVLCTTRSNPAARDIGFEALVNALMNAAGDSPPPLVPIPEDGEIVNPPPTPEEEEMELSYPSPSSTTATLGDENDADIEDAIDDEAVIVNNCRPGPSTALGQILGSIDENQETHMLHRLDREGTPVTQVRSHSNMQEILDELTNEIRCATHPLDHFTASGIRRVLVKTYRAVRAKARQYGIKKAKPKGQGQWARRGRRRMRRGRGKLTLPHVNELLHPVENEEMGELRDYYLTHLNTNSQNGNDNDSDTIIRLVDTATCFNPLAEYGMVLRAKRLNGDFGGPGEYPPFI